MKPRILVLGDLMLDRYVWGDASRVSPEAPVVILKADRHELRPGGAANAAAALRELGADVAVAGVTGDDGHGHALRDILAGPRLDQELMFVDSMRPSTTKQRFLGRASHRHAHQILRVDEEIDTPLDRELEAKLLVGIRSKLAALDAIVISDYGKGVCTAALLRAVIDAGQDSGVPVIVDPRRLPDFHDYARATVLKPNRLESEAGSGHLIRTPDDGARVAWELRGRFQFKQVFVTLDRDGIAFAGMREDHVDVAPALTRKVYDITGAGDIVTAVLAWCTVASLPADETARIANAAGALAVGEMGGCHPCWAAIADVEGSDTRACTREAIVRHVAAYRRQGRTIVFTNGCFDLLHVGHVNFLREAARLGDVLIVGLNRDASVRRLKGPARPVISERDRAAMLAALDCVDHVVVFDEDTPVPLLQCLRPDVLTKGGTTTEIVGRDVVEAYGGTVRSCTAAVDISTTSIVAHIRSTAHHS